MSDNWGLWLAQNNAHSLQSVSLEFPCWNVTWRSLAMAGTFPYQMTPTSCTIRPKNYWNLALKSPIKNTHVASWKMAEKWPVYTSKMRSSVTPRIIKFRSGIWNSFGHYPLLKNRFLNLNTNSHWDLRIGFLNNRNSVVSIPVINIDCHSV